MTLMSFVSRLLLALLCLGLVARGTPVTADAGCPTTSSSDWDYVIVGAGAGGGPLAARLALANYKVLLLDAGFDYFGNNYTIPFYSLRATEDTKTALWYYVNLYAPGSPQQVVDWYPRGSALGGSTGSNALIPVDQSEYSFNEIASITNDNSWSYTNMRRYFQKIERNLWIPKSQGLPAQHGYDGWLSIDREASNVYTDEPYFDPNLFPLYNNTLNALKPIFYPNGGDMNDPSANTNPGAGFMQETTNSIHNRSTVRDFLASTMQSKSNLVFQPYSFVTKILTCNSGSNISAYGVQYSTGSNLLPVTPDFAGKQKLQSKTVTAKYEVIISAGPYQTPQLLKLSGIGPKAELAKFNIPLVKDLPGVGENFQDRNEMAINFETRTAHIMTENCTLGDIPSKDPCLQQWIDTGHTNAYRDGAGILVNFTKSDPSLPHNDVFWTWTPSRFRGYLGPGYVAQLGEYPNYWTALFLKAYTQSKGWVRLTGSDPQDLLDINKNSFATPEAENDLKVLIQAIRTVRSFVAGTPSINKWIVQETWPGANVTTEAELESFVRTNTWGHHPCCTAKIGNSTDSTAVVDTNFKVYGINNLRIVDTSVFPNIPAFYITVPAYMLSEKAADVVVSYANAHGWTPSGAS